MSKHEPVIEKELHLLLEVTFVSLATHFLESRSITRWASSNSSYIFM